LYSFHHNKTSVFKSHKNHFVRAEAQLLPQIVLNIISHLASVCLSRQSKARARSSNRHLNDSMEITPLHLIMHEISDVLG